MTYAEALAESRETAKDEGLRLVRSVTVEPGRASIEVYETVPDASEERGVVHVIAASMKLRAMEGFSGTDVTDVVSLRNPNHAKLVAIQVTGCVGGFCPGGCGGGGEESRLLWEGGRWIDAPKALDSANLTAYGDHDGDGDHEFLTSLGDIDLGGCDARWCCSVLGRLSIRGLVGWDGTAWTDGMAKFRGYYVKQREENRRELEGLRAGATTREDRCRRLEAAAKELMLARVLCEDRTRTGEAFAADTEGLAPLDCAPDDPQLPFANIMITRSDLQAALERAELPRICDNR